jgi:DnaJ-class molecular chaperone
MNTFEARRILELHENFTPDDLKKKYRTLAMKYHPDKNKSENASQTFTQIQAAYEFLSKEPEQFEKVDDILSSIFKSFTMKFVSPQCIPRQCEILLTPKEYITGTTRKVQIKQRCHCEQNLCLFCAGSGFSLTGGPILDMCTKCMGDGYTQQCGICDHGNVTKNIHVVIEGKRTKINHPLLGIVHVDIEKPYFIKDNILYCYFDISLKESLIGFSKLFKDPFGEEHVISSSSIIRTNDGYKCKHVILVFRVIYPKHFEPNILEQLKHLDF